MNHRNLDCTLDRYSEPVIKSKDSIEFLFHFILCILLFFINSSRCSHVCAHNAFAKLHAIIFACQTSVLLLANYYYTIRDLHSQKHKILKHYGFSNLPMASTSRALDPNLDMSLHIFVPSPVSTEHTQSPAEEQDQSTGS